MRSRAARRLRSRLIERGVAPRHVDRLLAELGDHFDDLVTASLEAGLGREQAEARAERRLGALPDIERAVLSQPSLRSWAWRWPMLARVVYPAAWLAALPLVPIVAGMRHADSIVRWVICLAAGAAVTAAMLLLLQLSIRLA
jgi:hypothetical protein